MINNIGGLSVLELHIIAQEVLSQLRAIGLDIRRALIGTFITSFNAPGFSITLLGVDREMEDCLNEDTKITSWPNFIPASVLGAEVILSGVSETNTCAVDQDINSDVVFPSKKLTPMLCDWNMQVLTCELL
jgi:dihydroxyacetone kinase